MTTAANKAERTRINILTELYIDPELNTRAIEDSQEELETLAAQIETTGGLLQPIGIVPTPPEHATEHQFPYELIFGYRRCAACKYLAEQTGETHWVEDVKAEVQELATYEQRHLAQLIENLGRRDLHPMEAARAFKQVLEDKHTSMTQKELAKAIGWPEPTLSNYLKVAKVLSPKIQEKVLEGKLSWSNAKILAGYELPADQQDQLALVGQSQDAKEFTKTLQEHTGKVSPSSDEATTDVSTGKAADGTAEAEKPSTQKPAQGIRTQVLRDKYIPHVSELLKTAKDEREKLVLSARLDALQFAAGQDGTQLGKELQPWEEELMEKHEAEVLANEQNRLKTIFVRKAVTAIRTMLTETPDIHAADRRLPTIGEALAAIKEQVKIQLAEAKKNGLWADGETPVMPEGFVVANVDEFIGEISTAFEDAEKKRAENDKKRKEAAAKKKQEEEAAKLNQTAGKEGEEATKETATAGATA